MLKRIISAVGVWCVMSFPAWASTPSQMSTTLSTVFSQHISRFATQLTSSSSQLGQWTQATLVFLMFLALFFEILTFIRRPDFEHHMEVVCWILLTLIFWEYYSNIINGAWGLSEALSRAIREEATGSSNPFYLSEFTWRAIKGISYESEGGIFGALNAWVIGFFWYVLSFVFEAIMYLADMWSIWGAAVAKIVGVLFVPLMVFEKTRPWFDGWVKFFFGFLVANILLSITGVISAISLQAILETIRYTPCGGGFYVCIDSHFAYSATSNNHITGEIMLVMLICIALVASSFGFAKSLAMSMGSTTSQISSGVKLACTRAVAALL